ncbi:hypothetical protein ACFL1X_03335 [Candidatus Hydrogenedentota bacterium]
MAVFTTENQVRLTTQLMSTDTVSTELVTQCIADAHEELLGVLEPEYDVETPDVNVVRGETLLSAAYLLRSLASGAAFSEKQLKLGEMSVSGTNKGARLLTMSEESEGRAWSVLSKFLTDQDDPGFEVGASGTTEILGDED